MFGPRLSWQLVYFVESDGKYRGTTATKLNDVQKCKCFGILEVLLYYKGAAQPNDRHMLDGEKPVSQMLCYLLKVFRLRDNVFQVLLNQFKVLYVFMIKIYNSLLPG